MTKPALQDKFFIDEQNLVPIPKSTLPKPNQSQKQAIEHNQGPLLIIAGAGTGKTRVITERIANLINIGLARPEEILALTFTEKAAGEMEMRVDQLLPYGWTNTNIHTFHEFGNQILKQYALDLGLPPEFRVLGQQEQEVFLQDRFEEIENITHLRPLNHPFKYLRSIIKLINRAKDELITPADYLTCAQNLKQEADDDIKLIEAQRHHEAALIYQTYEDFKAESGVIDFGDQIMLTWQLLQKYPKIKHSLQKRFKYILVDEFQDTNRAQYQLIKLLTNRSNNLTVVGDDDQAIYRFRGAALSNILQFTQDFPQTKKIILTLNYRSTQAILDHAYRLIQNNNPHRLEKKLKINKKLVGQSQGRPPIFQWFFHERDELDFIITEIKKLQKSDEKIAILVRSNNLLRSIATALKLNDINFVAQGANNLINLPEIQGIIHFFQALVDPLNSTAIIKLALSPFYELDQTTILTLASLSKRQHTPIEKIMESIDLSTQISVLQKQKIQNFLQDLRNLRKLVGKNNAGEILYQFLKKRGILKKQMWDDPDHLEMLQNITQVFYAIQNFLCVGKDPFALKFVDHLPSLLSDMSADYQYYQYSSANQDSVQLLTIHAAKGLEFDTVFVPNFVSDRFPARDRRDPLELPSVFFSEYKGEGQNNYTEERRLAYVAFTRAKKRLFLTGAQFYEQAIRPKKVSPFIVEALNLKTLPPPIKRVAENSYLQFFAPNKTIATQLTFPQTQGTIKLSPSMIETYLNCPYLFYWKYVLRAPQEPNHWLNYGSAIHAGIETYFTARKKGRSNIEQLVLRRFAEAWKNEGFVSKAQENKMYLQGEKSLKNFMNRTNTEPLPHSIEATFAVSLPGVKISGRIDALYIHPSEIRDFKTGDVNTHAKALKKLKENLPIKIYALAFKHRFDKLPQKLTLDFVDSGVCVSIKPTDRLIDQTLKMIEKAVEGIKAGNFDPNPNQHFCDLCDSV